MCILKAFSETTSFKEFSESSEIPVYSCNEKGEWIDAEKGRAHTRYRISFDVSERDWDEFPEQVQDAIQFLERWGHQLAEFKSKYSPDEMVLDFPLWSRINSNIVNQNDTLPSRLIHLAGNLNLSIVMATYDPKAFEDSD